MKTESPKRSISDPRIFEGRLKRLKLVYITGNAAYAVILFCGLAFATSVTANLNPFTAGNTLSASIGLLMLAAFIGYGFMYYGYSVRTRKLSGHITMLKNHSRE